ncbi:unnamed protein product [Chrysodeixis includens]|uniref:Ketoreductase domain-containing protein n=1 Tax=Chrysodeixis includens TaxID=689277 RepID=A0A9P0BV39_CHRIL|nr:unnamed protein product [Chrysodeixis includens]
MSFCNAVVLITGGSAGIGAATAEVFAKEGASLAIVGRNKEKLNAVAKRCQELGAKTLTIVADLTKDEEADSIVKKTIDEFGKLNVLVNNAGIFRQSGIMADEFLTSFDEVMNTNIRAPVRITRSAVPSLIETKGNIVNVSSIAGTNVNRPTFIAYKTSKAALNHFTRCVAFELAPHGVRVNSVSPGPTRTNIFEGSTVNADTLLEKTALLRVSDPVEIADLILYVASDKAKSITGSNYIIDNGSMLK